MSKIKATKMMSIVAIDFILDKLMDIFPDSPRYLFLSRRPIEANVNESYVTTQLLKYQLFLTL